VDGHPFHIETAQPAAIQSNIRPVLKTQLAKE